MACCWMDLPRTWAAVNVVDQNGDSSGNSYSHRESGGRVNRRRKLAAAVSAGAFAVLAITSGVTLWNGAVTISNELQAATKLAPALKASLVSNDRESAAETVAELKTHTATARQVAIEPIWTLAGGLPWIGANFQAISEVATSADDVAQLAATPMVSVFQSLDWKSLTPSADGTNLKPLAAAQPKLASAAHAVKQSSDRLNEIDTDQLFPQVSEPLIAAREELQSLRRGLDAAANASSIAPNMMGAKSPHRYLLLIQNNAESRATGGIPGALAVITADQGKLTLESQTSAGAIGAFNPAMSVDPEQEAIYSRRLGTYMQDVNLTPDFPTSAKLAQTMWEKRGNQRVDGVISIDPVALSYILDATGPISINDPRVLDLAVGKLPTTLTGDNVVQALLSDVYSNITEPSLQDAYFAGVAKEIFVQLSSGRADPEKLLSGLSSGVDEGRVLVWSNDAEEQAVIANYRLSGAISGYGISPAQFGVYFNDGTGAKMDYYVKRTVQLVKTCSSGSGYEQTKVRVTSTNTAPGDASTVLPSYVTGGGSFGVPEGSVQTNIVSYGPVQSNVETVFVSGKKTGFASQRHDGRPVGGITIRLAPGQSKTVEFTFGKIVQHTDPELSVTPTVQPLKDVVLDTVSEKCVPGA
jgi:hypothetical protein